MATRHRSSRRGSRRPGAQAQAQAQAHMFAAAQLMNMCGLSSGMPSGVLSSGQHTGTVSPDTAARQAACGAFPYATAPLPEFSCGALPTGARSVGGCSTGSGGSRSLPGSGSNTPCGAPGRMRGPARGVGGSHRSSGNQSDEDVAGANNFRRRRRQDNREEDRMLYALNLARVRSGEDSRTTLMVRNIPNKYNQKMLLATIEDRHGGKFDLLYLPIDFKNRCNVGYAFINFISTADILPFYEEFNYKKWDRFNSDKVCEITYARIQGKVSLITHFENSSLVHEDEGYQPIIFASDGSGRREKLPLGGGSLGGGSQWRPLGPRMGQGMGGHGPPPPHHHGGPSQ